MSAEEISIYPEPTPNPATMKLLTDQTLLEKGSADFPDPDSAEKSPLAEKLFQVPGVQGIFIGRNFVTITKNDSGAWNNIIDLAMDGLRQHLIAGDPILLDSFETSVTDDDEMTSSIKKVLDDEIRPAVAMDGGAQEAILAFIQAQMD